MISFIYKKCQVLARQDMDSNVVFNLNIEPKYSDILKAYHINSKKRWKRKLEIFPDNADNLAKYSYILDDHRFHIIIFRH